MKSIAKVVIIGGGIQGISLAYHLARRGLTDVCLVEMKTLGSGSSGRSAAIIGHAFPTENALPLTELSFAALMRFQDELDADPGYEPIGCLLLAGAQGAPELRRRHALLQSKRSPELAEGGIDSHLVDRETISRLTPGLSLEGIEVGLYGPRDGGIDPHSIMMAYTHHARRLGVEFAEGVKATGLQIEGDRVMGVHTTAGCIATNRVVNAAGFRARPLAFSRALGAASVRSSPAASSGGWTDGSTSPELPAKQWQIRHKILMNISGDSYTGPMFVTLNIVYVVPIYLSAW